MLVHADAVLLSCAAPAVNVPILLSVIVIMLAISGTGTYPRLARLPVSSSQCPEHLLGLEDERLLVRRRRLDDLDQPE